MGEWSAWCFWGEGGAGRPAVSRGGTSPRPTQELRQRLEKRAAAGDVNRNHKGLQQLVPDEAVSGVAPAARVDDERHVRKRPPAQLEPRHRVRGQAAFPGAGG